MRAHRIETTLTEDRILTIKDLPFQAGDSVEIIILEHRSIPVVSDSYPPRGKVIHYNDPFEPATPLEDWEVLK